MMSPDDVLLEAIRVAGYEGDSPGLRERMCRKLDEAIAALLRGRDAKQG